MKKITDYTDEEKLELTDDQIEHLVDVECAEQGVKFLEAPTKTERTTPPKDVTLYDAVGLHFISQQEAEAVIKLINESNVVNIDYDYPLSSDHKYVKEDRHGDACATMRTTQVFSAGQYAKFKTELTTIKKEKDNYDEAFNEYKEHNNNRSEIHGEITDAIREVQREKDKKDWLVAEYGRYLALAEDNKVVAMNFLRRAHALNEGQVDELCPGYFSSPEKDEEKDEDSDDSSASA